MGALVLCWSQPRASWRPSKTSREQREAKARALAEGKLIEGGGKKIEK